MVTPSLVIIGEPNFLSRTTLRPFGPSVTLTESASLLTPRSSARRASVLKARVLAAMDILPELLRCAGLLNGGCGATADPTSPAAGPTQSAPAPRATGAESEERTTCRERRGRHAR